MSCVSNHSFYAVMKIKVVASPEKTVSHQSFSAFGSYNPSVSYSERSLSLGVEHDTGDPEWVKTPQV